MTPSRTEAVLAAVRQKLDAYRGVLDSGSDIGQIDVVVKLEAGTAIVRSTSVSVLHVERRTADRPRT